jgi:GNAT superfamily N-acetyltransferase
MGLFDYLRQKADQSRLAGMLELATSIGTGYPAQLGGGLAYLGGAAAGGSGAGLAAQKAVTDAFTYQPRTTSGQEISGMLGQAISPAMQYGTGKVNQAADAAYQYTGSPAAGAAVKTLPSLLDQVTGRMGNRARTVSMESGEREPYISWGKESDIDFDEDGIEIPSDPYVLINHLYVPPDMRGAGVGRRLLQDALSEIATEHPGLPIKLSAYPMDKQTDLESLVRFYESEGFDVTDTSGHGVGMTRR